MSRLPGFVAFTRLPALEQNHVSRVIGGYLRQEKRRALLVDSHCPLDGPRLFEPRPVFAQVCLDVLHEFIREMMWGLEILSGEVAEGLGPIVRVDVVEDFVVQARVATVLVRPHHEEVLLNKYFSAGFALDIAVEVREQVAWSEAHEQAERGERHFVCLLPGE